MSVHTETREQQLSSFEAFIRETYSQIDGTLSDVGWTREQIEGDVKMDVCPLNPEHSIPGQVLNSHVELCSWRREGYNNLDIPLPENASVNPDSASSIVLDTALQTSIIKVAKEQNPLLLTGDLETERPLPKTSNRLMADFTTDERRVIYDFIVSKTKSIGDMKVEELHMMGDMKKDETQRPKSKLELLIEQRDAKRRRISYRKKVHTNRKTQTEILREVIQNQMELLEQIIKGECEEEKDDESIVDEREDASSKNYKSLMVAEKVSAGDTVNSSKGQGKNNQKEIKQKYNTEENLQDDDTVRFFEETERKRGMTEKGSEIWLERRVYKERSRSRSSDRRVWSKKREENHYKRPSTSHGDRPGEDRHFYDSHREWEKSKREYRSNERYRDYSYRSKRNSDEWQNYSQFKYDRRTLKCDISGDYSENDQMSPVREKHSKHGFSQHREHFKYKSHDNYYVSSSKETHKHTKDIHRESKHSSEFNKGKYFAHTEETMEVEQLSRKEEKIPEVHKHSSKSKKSKKHKKHKHKSKKKHKKRKHSSSSSASPSTQSSWEKGSESS